MSRRVFISVVNRDFSPLRQLLRDVLVRARIDVVVQPDFPHTTTDTIQKLHGLIERCDLLIHIVGREPGDPANSKAVSDFFSHTPRDAFLDSLPEARQRLGDFSQLSYAFWEPWLALHQAKTRKIGVLVYAIDGHGAQDFPNREHLDALRMARRHAETLWDETARCGQITADIFNHYGIRLPADVPRPVHLPFGTIGELFKGREEFLRDLRQSLTRGSEGNATAVTSRAVHGLGGVGKTRLAVEYAWQHAEQYTAVLCITADSPENLQRNLAELTGPLVLDLEEQAAPEEEVRVTAALRWLANHPGWFLILDNVDTEEAALSVEQLLPKLRRGHVLITSRLSRWRGQVQPLELDVLTPEAAAELLLLSTEPRSGRGRKITPHDTEDAKDLARHLDGLALALEQAGAYIRARRKSFQEYIKLWQAHDAQVQEWHDEREMQYPRSVATTWLTTLEQLGEDERTLLNVLAWFAPEPVPTNVLSASFSSGEDVGDEETGESGDAERVDAVLANLADYSMLRWEGETVTVHRVVQEILRSRQDEPQQQLAVVLRLLERALFGANPLDVRSWAKWDPLRPHVAFAVTEADRLGISDPTSRLMNELGMLLFGKALYGEAEPLLRSSLVISEQAYGAEHPNLAANLNNLAQLLQATNRLSEAEPLMRRALAIDEQAIGAQDTIVAIGLNNLAGLLHATNRMTQAEPLLRRALAIDEQSYGAEHPDVARDFNNLAQLLLATNRLGAAEPMMRRALAISEQAYGAEHPNVATTLSNLAGLLKATNRMAQAEPLARRALAILEQAYGQDHPHVARDLDNLAGLLKATNRIAQAEPMMRRALTIFEQSYGPQHSYVAMSLNNLARLLAATNRLADAEQLMRRNVMILLRFERLTGHPHPHMKVAWANYHQLLTEMQLSEEEIRRCLQEVKETTEALAPIVPEVERMLGPAPPVEEVLSALDRQYRAEEKPGIYFLSLDQPIAPHLDELLGPALPIDDVLEGLDEQYRADGKPPVWFLPLDQPIAPHLNDLLGPPP